MIRSFLASVCLCVLLAASCVGQILCDYGDAPDNAAPMANYPSLLSSNGVYHRDTQYFWLGPGGATTELDSLQIDADTDDNRHWWARRRDDTGKETNWFITEVYYDLSQLTPTDSIFLNVLIDMDADGIWNGLGSPDEWAVKNYEITYDSLPTSTNYITVVHRVPDYFHPANMLSSNPNLPYLWTRVTLSESPAPGGTGYWGGLFYRGETEDFPVTTLIPNDPCTVALAGPAQLPPPPAKTWLVHDNKKLRAQGGFPQGSCPHGYQGALVPLCPAKGAPYYCKVFVPPATTSLKFKLETGVKGCCPHCSKLGAAEIRVSPAAAAGVKHVVAGGKNAWGPNVALSVKQGVVATVKPYVCFNSAPGHDKGRMWVDMIYDPANQYFAYVDTYAPTIPGSNTFRPVKYMITVDNNPTSIAVIDKNGDFQIDLLDIAALSEYWLRYCDVSNDYCAGMSYDGASFVEDYLDMPDFLGLCPAWLDRYQGNGSEPVFWEEPVPMDPGEELLDMEYVDTESPHDNMGPLEPYGEPGIE